MANFDYESILFLGKKIKFVGFYFKNIYTVFAREIKNNLPLWI